MDGHFCDNCECHLDESDYTSYGSWSYTCKTCGFTYHHGASPVQEQVDKFNNKFLTNIGDPKNSKKLIDRRMQERYIEYLKDKVIGEPQATEAHTVEQLKEMGIVGVYRK